MDIHHLRIFIAVHQNNSFSKAAEDLHISQPTISEHIKNLEAELDCTLFDRLGRSILPTPKAELLLPHALRVIEDLQKLTKAIHATDQNIQGELIISASTIPGTYLLPRLAAKFKQQHPQTRFQILINDTAKSIAKVVSHEIHLVVTGGNSKDVNLLETVFFEDQLVCVAEKKLAGEKLNKPHALPMLIREQGSGTRHAMEEILKQAQIPMEDRKIAAILGSTAAIKEALLAGLGFSIISRMAVKEELASGRLVQLPLPKIDMTRPLVFISHKKRTLPHRYQAFVEMVKKEGLKS